MKNRNVCLSILVLLHKRQRFRQKHLVTADGKNRHKRGSQSLQNTFTNSSNPQKDSSIFFKTPYKVYLGLLKHLTEMKSHDE